MSVEKEKLVWLFQDDSLFQSGKKKVKDSQVFLSTSFQLKKG